MRHSLTVILVSVGVLFACAQDVDIPITYQNPILPGFYPDPSICRVGDDYYMVNSSFQWWPGIPIWHSRDLVNWEQIGHAIHRKGQICENPNIWAPTIRYHQGKYYIICTERPGTVFYIVADNPEGPWSDAVYFDISEEKVSAIDPSLFWDDDGTCWLAANDRKKSGTMKHWVWIQKVNLNPVYRNNRLEATFIGERKYITDGSGVGPDNYAEGPHIYKVDNYYYLMIAEGGTWDNHAVSFLRTDNLEKPAEEWEFCPFNPVLTHRDKESSISATGHADLVRTTNGEWWAVHLGVRKQEGKHKLGRETFLVKVKWKQDEMGRYWPVFNPEKGNMTPTEDIRPNIPWTPVDGWPVRDDFNKPQLRYEWNFYHEPSSFDWYQVKDGQLEIHLLPNKATDVKDFAYIARRQQHHDFDVLVKMKFVPKDTTESAGLMAFTNNSHNIRLEITKGNAGAALARVFNVDGQKEHITGAALLHNKNATYYLKIEARGWDFYFLVGTSVEKLMSVGSAQNARILSSEVAKGFTGSYVGMYASSNYTQSKNKAHFDWFEYLPVDEISNNK